MQPTNGSTVVVVPQPAGWWSRTFSWLGWSLFGLTLLALMGVSARVSDYLDTTHGIKEKFVQGSEMATDKVAVISIEGVITEGQGFVKHQIDRVRNDKHVKAIVLRVDSPGGTVTGSDYILHHLKKLRQEKGNIPLVVSMGSMAASGGYYVSMAVEDQEKSIFAEPTTTTGSIGVIIPHYDLSKLMDRLDVRDDSIASGPRKQMLSMTRPLDDEQRKLVQDWINESFARFKDIIKSGRPRFAKQPELLDELATGEIFSANKAKASGLVDEIGFLEDAIARAMEAASLDATKTRVVKYARQATLLDLEGLSTAHAQGNSLASWVEMSLPRPYYLSNLVPAMLTSRRAD